MTTKSVMEIDLTIAQLQKEREVAVKEAEKYSFPQRVAIILHDETCDRDHTDDCAWHYEKDNKGHKFDTAVHTVWLQRARAMIERVHTIKPMTEAETIGVVWAVVTKK